MQSTPKRVLFLCYNTSTIQAVLVTEIIVRGANRDKNSLLGGKKNLYRQSPERSEDLIEERKNLKKIYVSLVLQSICQSLEA